MVLTSRGIHEEVCWRSPVRRTTEREGEEASPQETFARRRDCEKSRKFRVGISFGIIGMLAQAKIQITTLEPDAYQCRR